MSGSLYAAVLDAFLRERRLRVLDFGFGRTDAGSSCRTRSNPETTSVNTVVAYSHCQSSSDM